MPDETIGTVLYDPMPTFALNPRSGRHEMIRCSAYGLMTSDERTQLLEDHHEEQRERAATVEWAEADRWFEIVEAWKTIDQIAGRPENSQVRAHE